MCFSNKFVSKIKIQNTNLLQVYQTQAANWDEEIQTAPPGMGKDVPNPCSLDDVLGQTQRPSRPRENLDQILQQIRCERAQNGTQTHQKPGFADSIAHGCTGSFPLDFPTTQRARVP